MDVFQASQDPIRCVSSAAPNSDGDLLSLRYVRVRPESPEYIAVYQSIEQNVDIAITTFVFRAAPEPVLSLYEFIMTTFVPEKTNKIARPSPNADSDGPQPSDSDPPATDVSPGKIKVALRLASIEGTHLTVYHLYRDS